VAKAYRLFDVREIAKVKPIEGRRLEITFDDGATAIVDIKPLMKRQVFQPLQDETFFRKVEIDGNIAGLLCNLFGGGSLRSGVPRLEPGNEKYYNGLTGPTYVSIGSRLKSANKKRTRDMLRAS
jgi:hypothetical protein